MKRRGRCKHVLMVMMIKILDYYDVDDAKKAMEKDCNCANDNIDNDDHDNNNYSDVIDDDDDENGMMTIIMIR